MKILTLLACLVSLTLMACPPKVPGSPAEPNQVEDADPNDAQAIAPAKPQEANRPPPASPNVREVDPNTHAAGTVRTGPVTIVHGRDAHGSAPTPPAPAHR